MTITDWESYISSLPTIENELNNLPKPENFQKSIYVIHMPPNKLGLDVCSDGREVGSKAVYDFLKQKQPLFSLHGHIHESPDKTGIWSAKLGDTVCIQPGQMYGLTYVTIYTEKMKYETDVYMDF